MASLAEKTKNTNTFRFKSFGERVDEIDLRHSALYRIGHRNEELEEADGEGVGETYFQQTLQKWNVLNLTEEYHAFSKRCRRIVTLPQLLLQKEFVVDLLLEHLATATNLSQQPLLELLAVLAQDLREDFCPYFQRILDRLICLLKTQDAEQLEWTLFCLAHLFKSLKPYLRRNIGVVFNSILPLLDERHNDEHVTNFAVECFAFIARDVRDFPRFLAYVLKTMLREQVQSIHGSGRLIYEIMRGPHGQLHISAGDIFTHVLEGLINKDAAYTEDQVTLLGDIASHCLQLLLKFITPDQSAVLWQKLCTFSALKDVDASHMIYLMIQIVDHQGGRMVCELPLILRTLTGLLDTNAGPPIYLISLATSLLTKPLTKLTQLQASSLLQKLLNVCKSDASVYKETVLRLLDCSQFDYMVLPPVIAYYEDQREPETLELLARIVLHKRPFNVDSTSAVLCHDLAIQFKKVETFKFVEKQLTELDAKKEDHLLWLLLAPHMKGISTKFLEPVLQIAINRALDNSDCDFKIMRLLLQTHSQMKFKISSELRCKLRDYLLPAVSKDLLALSCLQLVLLETPAGEVSASGEVVAVVSSLLSHPERLFRVLSASCLNTLHGGNTNPYSHFYSAVIIEPTVFTHRELLLQLDQLDPAAAQFQEFNQLPHFKEHAVNLLLGLLYHNFKLIWAPLQGLLRAYAKAMTVDEFWTPFKAKLEEAMACIHYKPDEGTLPTDTPSERYNSSALNIYDNAVTHTQRTLQQNVKYRQLLWEGLAPLVNILEQKNADLVRLFLLFVNQEYREQLEKTEYTWNVDGTMAHVDADDEDGESTLDSRAPIKRRNHSPHAKLILETLQIKLTCFVAQPNPKALHRQAEMHEFYLELLSKPYATLQLEALKCLAAYKQPTGLMELSSFTDDTKLKDTLIEFKVNSLTAQHRKEMMPFLLRLLYGKMLTKGSQHRRTQILRFLGQLEESEIMDFVHMAFDKFSACTDKPVDAVAAHVRSSFDRTSVTSAKQLQRILHVLELIRKEFAGRLSPDFQRYVLKLLLFVGSVAQEVINIESKLMAPYKNVKHSGLQTLGSYFGQLVDMEDLWQDTEMTAIAEVYIWPGLARLSQDSIHTPTPLVKLVLLWGAEPRYQKYLNHGSQPIMPHLIDLLLNEKAKPAVKKALLQLVEQLLETAEAENYGPVALSILQPHIPSILQYLQNSWRQKKASKMSMDKLQLHILTLITSYVKEPATCELLLQVVLPIFTKQVTVADHETVVQLVTTLSNLLERVERPQDYVRTLAPLFEQVHVLPARKLLCDILANMAKRLHNEAKTNLELRETAEELREWTRIILLLNAWDKRWLEQPDYDKRLGAVSELKTLVAKEDNKLDLQLGVLVVYNCFYLLRHDSDLGMRVNIEELLKLLLPRITVKLEAKEDIHFWLEDTVLPLLQRCMRDDKHDNARSAAIGLLGELAGQCPSSHEVLKDLAPLTDKHDHDVDFFENILHLQTQRHGRALQRLVNISNGCWRTSPPCARTLTQYLMPLATRYLLSEKHSGRPTLIDTAIEAVGVMCEMLPWTQYHAVLRYYLKKLRYAQGQQKQCVRLVVRILDAFHFDLSQAETDLNALQELNQKLREEVAEKETSKTETPKDGEESEGAEVAEDVEEDPFEKEDPDQADLDVGEEELAVVPVVQRQRTQLLAPNAAKKVMTTITTVLLPTLNRAITEKTNYDTKHKVNRRRLSYEREEEEIQRVPISLAMVKLLQKLPSELLDNSLPGIFMKVCTFLRSPLKSVRLLTRDILKKIMLTLGGSYLGLLLEQMQSLLTRGFQVHVLSVTLHGVLDALKAQLQPDHIESCLQNLLEVALNDIFGDVNAEKEVDKIVAHTPEAKPSAKSYITLHIAARHIRDNCLLDLLLPFKEHLARSQSRKLTRKIQECFAKIGDGLVENTHIARESLLIFIYGTMSESISDLLPGTQKRRLTQKEQELMRRARPDCLIVQPAPGRRSVSTGNMQVKSCANANAHILIEFGLELLHFVLKRKKLNDLDYQPFLNPLLPLLRDSLKSKYARATTYALKCYTAFWLGEYELANLRDQELTPVVERMFEILNNFSTFGATRQEENAQLVRASFKAVVALLRKCQDYKLTDEQIEQLLLHIEQELQEGECSSQSMVFVLLKALVNRKVDTRSLHDLMQTLGNLTVTSPSDYVRDESRNILLTYIMEYTLKQKVDQIINHMSAQLCYSQSAGRLSAIEFMHSIIKKFPLQMLFKRSEFLYVSLGTRMLNDEDIPCRRKVATAVETLIGRLNKTQRQPLLNLTVLLLTSNEKPGVRQLAASLLSRFVEAERSGFAERLLTVLPTLVEVLFLGNTNAGGRYVRAPGYLTGGSLDLAVPKKKRKLSSEHLPGEELLLAGLDTDANLEQQESNMDHLVIQLLYCLLNIFEHCGESLMSNVELAETVDELAYGCQRLLGHDHNWVRCNAAKLLTKIVSHYDFALVGELLSGIKQENSTAKQTLVFIYSHPAQDIRTLVLDLCAQVTPGETAAEMIEPLSEMLLYVGHMLRDVPFNSKEENNAAEGDEPKNKIHLMWLLRNIHTLVKKEVSKASHDTSIRSAMFTLIEGFITLLSVETVTRLALALLQILVREMSEEDQNVDPTLRQQALRVGSRLRKRIGTDLYDRLRNQVQTKLMVRRAERRKEVAQEKIHDPERAAKRKAGRQERKKTAKRLKTAVMRGKAPDLKQKLKKRKRKALMEA
ncbi:hypothetical protein KR018_004754 [Drosophila ironensis]|nr:hypothetical protein KR018_004754 [Drosophila ironensis]